MFTGIIAAIGKIERITQNANGMTLIINSGELDLKDVSIGDSIATNGICLTVTEVLPKGYKADVSDESSGLTTISNYKVGTLLNLEKALTLATPLGGHLVSGHVDGIAEVLSRQDLGTCCEFWIKIPSSLKKYIAHKGSITIDGVSLTVNTVESDKFRLTVIPHTLNQTTLVNLKPGSTVNIEIDVLARYIEQLFINTVDKEKEQGISMDLLAKSGFLR